MANHLETLVELQQKLDELKSQEFLLTGVPDWMAELHQEHSEKKLEIDRLAEVVEDAAAARRSAETQASDHEEKLKHFQGQIGLVQTQREYGALLQEIDAAKEQIKSFEDQALNSLAAQDKAQEEADQLTENFKELDESYGVELAKWEAEKPKVRLEVEGLSTKTEALKETLPRPILTQFLRVFERYDGFAVAALRKVVKPGGKGPVEWHCGACNYRVRPQVVVDIRANGTAQTCDSCRRFLFSTAEDVV